MAQVNSNDNGFAGEYMVQDNDHMGSSNAKSQSAKPKRQPEHRQPQQGSQSGSRQQGGERRSRR